MTCRDCTWDCFRLFDDKWMLYRESAEVLCDHFDDKRLMVVFPVRIGGTAYAVGETYAEGHYEVVPVTFEKYQRTELGESFYFREIGIGGNNGLIEFSRDAFGRRVFLTKSEAEDAVMQINARIALAKLADRIEKR